MMLTAPVFAGECETNYAGSGSLLKGKTYATHADFAGVEPAVAWDRLATYLAAEGLIIQSSDRDAGTISAMAKIADKKMAPVEVKAIPIDGGTRVHFSIDLPGGVFANTATKTTICRFVEAARIDPATRYGHPLVTFIRHNQNSAEKVAVVQSNTGKRLAKVALGAAVGAVVGAVTAKATGRDVTEGALVGALAGGAITFGITKIQDKRLASRDEVMRAESYDPAQGYRAGVRNVVVTPETVKPGGKITVVTTYWALAPNDAEKLGLHRYAGISVSGVYLRGFRFNPEPFQFGAGGGEFQTTIEVSLPETVSPGSYNVHWVVDGQSTGGDVAATFTVAG
jgi:hypothetical protein